MESLEKEAHDIETMLEAHRSRLLEGKTEAERQQDFLSELDAAVDAETLCSTGRSARPGSVRLWDDSMGSAPAIA